MVTTTVFASIEDLAVEKRQIRGWIGSEQADLAVRRLRSLLPAHPDDGYLHILLGEAYYVQDKFAEAVGSFETGVKLRPEWRGRMFNLGRSYQKLNQPDKAAEIYRAMQKGDDGALRSKAYFGQGLLEEEEGRDQEAEASFLKSIAIDPESHRPRYRLGLILLHRGEVETAISGANCVMRRAASSSCVGFT